MVKQSKATHTHTVTRGWLKRDAEWKKSWRAEVGGKKMVMEDVYGATEGQKGATAGGEGGGMMNMMNMMYNNI